MANQEIDLTSPEEATMATETNKLAEINKLLIEAHKRCIDIVTSSDVELLNGHYPFPGADETRSAVAIMAERIKHVNDLSVMSWMPTFEKLAHLKKGADLVETAKNKKKTDQANRGAKRNKT